MRVLKGGKKLVYVPEDVLEAIAEVCRRKGVAVGRFIEDALKQAVRLEKLGYNLEEAADTLEVIRAQKVLGGAFTPQEVLNFLVDAVYKAKSEELMERCFEAGRLYGRYMRERFREPVEALKSFLQISRWDLSEVNVASEGGVTRLRCVSTVLSAEGTGMLAKFVEGAVSGLGCEVLKVEFIRGIVIVEFKQP
ncbi:MAG: hypothetical protein N3F10_03240 [Candidatus Bathyarchaeota archaeon]|nr:hypothetical protein [Candidatus Bathyarchaeota archaeon]